MRKRMYIALLVFVPVLAWAQGAVPSQGPPSIAEPVLRDPAGTAETSRQASGAQGPLQETLREGKGMRDSIAARRMNPVVRYVSDPAILSKEKPVKPRPLNALTVQVIMAQKHSGISDEQWRKMMLDPVNATLYPLRLTQAMLDTLDATQLDPRYRYELVR